MPRNLTLLGGGAPKSRNRRRTRVAPPQGTSAAPTAAPGAASQRLSQAGKAALLFALISGAITHGYHLFDYPLYSTDEGIYVERAWSVIREGQLSPQTYYYDHAPGGWILLAFWDFVLPKGFETFGNPINSGRALMLILHVVNVYFLFQIARKFSKGGLLAPTIACFFFNFSPLAVYYQRMILLDNFMVFWFLLSLYMLLHKESQLFVGAWSGLAFGIAVVTKENALFFAPSMLYLLAWRAREDVNRRFAMMMWLFTSSAAIILYLLLSTLKGELLPTGFDFSLSHSPQGHVSLLYEMWYQMHRTEGALFAKGSFLYVMWLPKDRYLLGAGAAAMLISLLIGWGERHRDPAMLVTGTLSLEIALYLARGSVLLDFYVIPLLPLFALNIGMVADRMLKSLPQPAARVISPAICACVAAFLVLPSGGYLVKHGVHRNLQPADTYYVPETFMQNDQIAWIRAHIPPNDTIVSDDDIWVQLHDVKPIYPYDQSHWNAATDPQIRNNLFHANWRNIDYIVLSNGMQHAMTINNGGGQEGYIITALNHSVKVWSVVHGEVSLSIYKVQNLSWGRVK
jgi:4-amino-4-deoxy-L-arabinose transferase-like glycosyltransferase